MIKAMSVSLMETRKTKNKNVGVFKFTIRGVPNVPLSSALLHNVSLECVQKHKVQEWSFVSNILTVSVEYF